MDIVRKIISHLISSDYETNINLPLIDHISSHKMLRDGESNPGLPRDRRGYSPLYYRGVDNSSKILTIY